MRTGYVISMVSAIIFSFANVAYSEDCGMSSNGQWRCISGSGDITILLNAGARLTSLTWDPLVSELATFGVVVRFDRPGLGRSPAVDGVRTPRTLASEMAAMIDEFGHRRSLILVGHSAGGYHMLRFAAEYPERVIGVVLIDTPHPAFEDRRLALLTARQRREREVAVAASRAAASPAVQAEYAAAERDGALDFGDFPVDTPLVVVTGDSQDFGYPSVAAELHAAWVEEQRRWLLLSAKSRLVVAVGAAHMVHRERPELIVDAIGRLATRDSER
ncbi:MAG: alpha/beta hydrolase [Pseudomonadota bacterium]